MKAQRMSSDIISPLPLPIIETILCFLPIQEAGRTSILSKEWRYHWTTIPKLVFDEAMYSLPLHSFSFHQLTDLYLKNCVFQHQPTFIGFDSLTTLHIHEVDISKKTLVQFLSNCPSLKTFSLLQHRESIYSDDKSGLIELFQCLRVIEHLTISLWGIMCFGEDLHPRELPTSLVHLKYLSLESMNFLASRCYGLPFLALLIRASPNLKKIKLWMDTYPDLVIWPFQKKLEIKSEQSDANEDYSDIWLENLSELEIVNFNNLKPDLEFVKLMLAKSPVLNKVKIILNNVIDEDEELEMLTLLSSYPRASPVVDITVPGRFRWNL